jgi:hypothetical protein
MARGLTTGYDPAASRMPLLVSRDPDYDTPAALRAL